MENTVRVAILDDHQSILDGFSDKSLSANNLLGKLGANLSNFFVFDGFGVATFQEALSLVKAGVNKPILLLEGCVSEDQCRQAAALGLHQMFHHAGQVAWLRNFGNDQVIPAWIKLDTGMHRIGFMPDDVPAVIRELEANPNVILQGFASHFACADEATNAMNQQQISNFLLGSNADYLRCMANSAAIWNLPDSHFDWVRPGISLYGATPIATTPAAELGLQAVMTLTAPVISERWIEPGESAGYGRRWRARRPTRLVTLAMGYGDGYPRHAPDGTPVFICGQEVPLAGKVSMDMMTVDATDIKGELIGVHAELWGKNLPVDKVASWVGTIGYELLTRVSPRVDRRYI